MIDALRFLPLVLKGITRNRARSALTIGSVAAAGVDRDNGTSNATDE